MFRTCARARCPTSSLAYEIRQEGQYPCRLTYLNGLRNIQFDGVWLTAVMELEDMRRYPGSESEYSFDALQVESWEH